MSEEERAGVLKQKRKAEAVRRENMSEQEKADLVKHRREVKAAHKATMPEEERAEMLKQKRSDETERRQKSKAKVLTIQEASVNFQKKCKDLPEFVCTVCHRLLWRRSVVVFKELNYNFDYDVVKRCFVPENRKETRPNEAYVCTTCQNDLRRKKPLMPAQAVANGLKLPPQPNIPAPNDLERRLFSLACPFMKIGGLPRGGQFRLQGPCINVPTNLSPVCELLPRLPDEAGVILLKFKRKLAYKGHYMYDSVRPAVVLAWLQWLKENNPLYKDIDVRSNWNQLLSEYEKRELSSDSERIERGHELTHTTGGLEHCLGKQKDNIGPSRSLPEESTSINVETDAEHAGEDVLEVNTDNVWSWLEGLLEHYNGLIHVCVDVTRIFTREMWIKQAESIQVLHKRLTTGDNPEVLRKLKSVLEDEIDKDVVKKCDFMLDFWYAVKAAVVTFAEWTKTRMEASLSFIENSEFMRACTELQLPQDAKSVEHDYNTCSCLRDLHVEAALSDFLVYEKPHSELTLIEALNHHLERSTDDIVHMVIRDLKRQLQRGDISPEERRSNHHYINEVHNHIFTPDSVLPSIRDSLHCTIYLYRFPGGRRTCYPYLGKDPNPKVITLGVCNGHYVALKTVAEAKPADVNEVQVLHHFQDQAATDRQAELVGHPQQTWIKYKDMAEIFSLAPAEGNTPTSMFNDPLIEARTFPDIYPTAVGGFDPNEKRERKLSRRRFCNQRYLNVDNRCVQSEYILMTQYMTDAEHIESNKSIAMRMARGKTQGNQKITAKFCKDSENIANLVKADRAFTILNELRDSPPFMQKKQYEAYAMVRQLGLPTFFISLSAADLHWTDFLMAVAHQQGKFYTEKKIEALTWQERCDLIRSNPVTAVRMFKYRLDNLFTHFLESSANPLGQMSDKIKKIEFQGRGTPHNHSLLWIEGAPQFIPGDEENNKKVCEFIERYICARIPEGDDEKSKKLRELVLRLQIHKHSSYCRRNGKCRFGIPAAPSPITLISEKPDEDVSKKVKEATSVLQEVMKVVICFPDMPLELALNMAKVSYNDYIDALAVSCNAHRVVLRREPKDCFVNPYNPDILLNWEANIDVQYVLDAYSCIMYLVSYVLKDERSLSDMLRRVSKENKNETIRKQMDVVGSKFLGTREMPIQKAIMMELSIPIFEKSRQCIFVSAEPRESRVSLLKGKEELESMEDDEEDIFHKSIHDKYAARPDDLEDDCLVHFAANYSYSTQLLDDEETDQDVIPHAESETIKSGPKKAKRIRLKDNMGTIIPRAKPAIVRLHTYSKHKEREKYFHAQLILFLPWRNEEELKEGYESYEDHYAEVQSVVIANAEPFNRNLEEIEQAQADYEKYGPPESAWDRVAPSLQDEVGQAVAEGVSDERNIDEEDVLAHENLTLGKDRPGDTVIVKYTKEAKRDIMPPEEYRRLVHSLNKGQFKYIKHLRQHIKCNVVRMKNHQKPIPLRDFVTGPAGTGKSYVIRLAHRDMVYFPTKARLTEVGKPVVLLTAPSGVAAYNIGGMTVHSGLSLSQYALGREKASLLKTHLGNLLYLIVDEVSFESSNLLDKIHDRLVLVKQTTPDISFGGVGMMKNGDLYQLKPVMQPYIFQEKTKHKEPGDFAPSHWREFRMHELTEIMRQQENNFATVLNNIRTCGIDGVREGSEEDKVLLSRVLKIEEDNPAYPHNLLHVYARRKDADAYNDRRLAQLTGQCFSSKAAIKTNAKCEIHFPGDDPRDTGNIAVVLEMKIGARVMMPVNIDVTDGLYNGAMGNIVDVRVGSDGQPEIVWVKFDNREAGASAKHSRPPHPYHKNAVPITKTEVTFFKHDQRSVECHIVQFPLVLCYGLTIHKTQGLTVEGIVVNMTQGTFQHGQAYVAFSRVRKVDGLYIIGYDRKKVTSSPEVDQEMERLRQNVIPDLPEPVISSGNILLSIGHLNIQGLMSSKDYLADDPLIQCDVLCLTETRLSHPVLDKKLPFPSSDIIERKDRNKDGGGVLIRARQRTKAVPIQLTPSAIEIAAVEILCPERVVVICCYNPPTADKDAFVVGLTKVLEVFQNRSVIVLGDFNEDLYVYQLKEGEENVEVADEQGKCKKIYNAMGELGFSQIIHEPTHDSGSQLDHIYVKNIQMDQTDVQDIYFSDHDATYCFKTT